MFGYADRQKRSVLKTVTTGAENVLIGLVVILKVLELGIQTIIIITASSCIILILKSLDFELTWAQQNNKPIVGFYETKFFSYGCEDIKKEKLKEFKKYVHPWVYECCDRIESGDEAIYSILDYIEKYYGEGEIV